MFFSLTPVNIVVGAIFYFNSKTSDQFTAGGWKLPSWVVGMSIIATFVSSISFLALPLNALFGWDIKTVIIITGLIVIIYSMPGAIKAVFWTDAIHGIILITGALVCAIIQNDKELMAAWFGGTREKNPDVCIWISRYEKGSWTKPVKAANGVQYEGKRYPCWNPVLFKSGKVILLFYKVGPSPSGWWGMMKTTTGKGKSWSRAYRLPEGIIGPVKNKPVSLNDGYLLCPSSTEDAGWRLHMEFTHDNGSTWQRIPAINDTATEAIQPSVLIHKDGRLQLLCRSTRSEILTAWSDDMDRTWTELASSGLPNPNSGIDVVTLKDGRHIVIYNHLVKGRQMLNAAVSKDGINWNAAFLLKSEEQGNEFSYPAVIQSSDGLVHITYTWKRKLIRHVVVDPSLISERPFNSGEWPE